MDPLSTAVAVLSIVLAVLSIALSIGFYLASDKSSKEAARSLSDARSTLKSVESAVQVLREESFALLRETQGDFRQLVFASFRIEPAAGKSVVAESSPAAADSGARPPVRRRSTSDSGSPTKNELWRTALMLENHMRDKRGDDFPLALAELHKRIRETLRSREEEFISNGELYEIVKHDVSGGTGRSFDISEVIFASFDLAKSGYVSGRQLGSPEPDPGLAH